MKYLIVHTQHNIDNCPDKIGYITSAGLQEGIHYRVVSEEELDFINDEKFQDTDLSGPSIQNGFDEYLDGITSAIFEQLNPEMRHIARKSIQTYLEGKLMKWNMGNFGVDDHVPEEHKVGIDLNKGQLYLVQLVDNTWSEAQYLHCRHNKIGGKLQHLFLLPDGDDDHKIAISENHIMDRVKQYTVTRKQGAGKTIIPKGTEVMFSIHPSSATELAEKHKVHGFPYNSKGFWERLDGEIGTVRGSIIPDEGGYRQYDIEFDNHRIGKIGGEHLTIEE